MLQQILADLALTAKKRMPGLYGLVRDAAPSLIRNRVSYEVYRRNLGALANREQIFTKIYHSGWWGSPESKSGAGSQLSRTETFRGAFQAWLEDNRVASLLDAPCGDYNWMQHVRLPARFRYIGGDIVGELIESNRARFPAVEFRQMDIVSDALPCVDAWLCRDALIHFPNSSAGAIMERFADSGIGFLLATTFPSVSDNRDIEFGQYRPLNLQLPPFNLPPPERILPDDDDAGGRVIGIWSREAIGRAGQSR